MSLSRFLLSVNNDHFYISQVPTRNSNVWKLLSQWISCVSAFESPVQKIIRITKLNFREMFYCYDGVMIILWKTLDKFCNEIPKEILLLSPRVSFKGNWSMKMLRFTSFKFCFAVFMFYSKWKTFVLCFRYFLNTNSEKVLWHCSSCFFFCILLFFVI